MIKSEEFEELKLTNNVNYKEQIDKWLTGLEKSMVETLKILMNECIKVYEEKVEMEQEMERKEWLARFNSQLVVTIGQLLWTRECEKAFEKRRPIEGLVEVKDLIEE